jgi:hypothetical protein
MQPKIASEPSEPKLRRDASSHVRPPLDTSMFGGACRLSLTAQGYRPAWYALPSDQYKWFIVSVSVLADN